MGWNTKVDYLKRNPVAVATQIDYVFKEWKGKFILCEMQVPIGQILIFDDWREFQNRGISRCQIHIVDAPKIDENEDSEIVEFIDKYIMCFTWWYKIPWNEQLSKVRADPPSYNHL